MKLKSREKINTKCTNSAHYATKSHTHTHKHTRQLTYKIFKTWQQLTKKNKSYGRHIMSLNNTPK